VVRIVSRQTLQTFWTKHPQAQVPLRAWFHEVDKSRWTGPADIKSRYPSASFVTGERVVFNIGGNDFRLVTHVRFDLHAVFIRFVGTHAEYDRIDARTV
jgi:mRNA interferase HigB